MAEYNSRDFAMELTITAVDGDPSSTRKPAAAAFRGQVSRYRAPTITERSSTRQGQAIAPQVDPRGIESAIAEIDTPSERSKFWPLQGRQLAATVVISSRLTDVASDGAFQFDREKHTLNGRITSLDAGGNHARRRQHDVGDVSSEGRVRGGGARRGRARLTQRHSRPTPPITSSRRVRTPATISTRTSRIPWRLSEWTR